MSTSTPASPSRQSGFTLIELLVAAALALIVIGAASALLTTTARVQSVEQERIPLQESVRSSLEVIAQDLRQATGSRVLYSEASVPTDLKSVLSTNQVLSITTANTNGYFTIPKPGGYPSSNSFSRNAVTPVNSPNSAGRSCSDVFTGDDWALVMVGTQTRWVQTHETNPCTGNDSGGGNGNIKLQHHGYTLDDMSWSPDAALIKISVIRYYVGTAQLGTQNVSTLYRQIDGQDPQVVAYYISGLKLEYSPDGLTFSNAPTNSPSVVRVTLTGQESRTRTSGGTPTFSLTNSVFMRKATLNAAP